jgi:hypothetical protein
MWLEVLVALLHENDHFLALGLLLSTHESEQNPHFHNNDDDDNDVT